ncbi:rhodanese-related sulfurtransferase [Rhodovulum bhavnagarense]|uniref:Rhodanese-related sulfurtransferase n=1 Tax=Rhodovulum bhavnagarense TaxID=992286 RepID=A0A4R2RFN1_9RHOB|nr:rhodanese-like domain-containing protein [Rhodovulum bhavnagarense]TCP62422.1 rhodanese-related sulfurtransferase [Rhodovulum bhavnagarense]
MNRPIAARALALASILALWSTAQAVAQDDPVAEAIRDYMDFAPYEAGIILPDQITPELISRVTFVDARSADQYRAGTIPGALNVEWREIPARLDELPDEGLVVLFCNTGSLSAQAAFAARLMGRENIVVLQTGINGWMAR